MKKLNQKLDALESSEGGQGSEKQNEEDEEDSDDEFGEFFNEEMAEEALRDSIKKESGRVLVCRESGKLRSSKEPEGERTGSPTASFSRKPSMMSVID